MEVTEALTTEVKESSFGFKHRIEAYKSKKT